MDAVGQAALREAGIGIKLSPFAKGVAHRHAQHGVSRGIFTVPGSVSDRHLENPLT